MPANEVPGGENRYGADVSMRDDDFKEMRRLLEQAQEDAATARKHSEELRRALLEVPLGAPKDERPLIDGMRVMWRAYQRGAWVTRAVFVITPLIAAVGTAILTIKGWMPFNK